jgi:hypothetical protein
MLPFRLVPTLEDAACDVDLGDLVESFWGLGVVKFIDNEELEADGEWSDSCRRGGVRDMTRERGGDNVESIEFPRYEVGDSDIYREVVRVLRIEPVTEGTGLAEVDLDIVRLFCLATSGLRMLLERIFEVDLLGSNRGKL